MDTHETRVYLRVSGNGLRKVVGRVAGLFVKVQTRDKLLACLVYRLFSLASAQSISDSEEETLDMFPLETLKSLETGWESTVIQD